MTQDRSKMVNLFSRQTDMVRGNLVTVCRLAMKTLIDQSCFFSISDECEEFINFCAVLEGILSHRLKSGKSWMGGRHFHYWDYLQATCRLMPHSCISNIAAIENIRSPEAKGRAFIRCALMEKRLSEYLTFAMKQVHLTKKFYEDGAVMLSDDAPVLCGMLLGLNAIDFSFCLKGSNSELMGPLEVNFKPYLQFHQSMDSLHSDAEEMRELSVSSLSSSVMAEEACTDLSDSEARLRQLERQYRTAAEQKGYLEELVKLREGQLEEAQEQATNSQSRLHRLENDWRAERRQFETIILELQGQLMTMKSVYHALRQKLVSMTAQQQRHPPQASQLPSEVSMVEFASDATVSYSAVSQRLSDSFHMAEMSQSSSPAAGGHRRQQDRPNLVAASSAASRDDNRSLVSGSSGLFRAQEDSQSMIPLAGSISSEFGIRPGQDNASLQVTGSEFASVGGQLDDRDRTAGVAPSDDASLSSVEPVTEGEAEAAMGGVAAAESISPIGVERESDGNVTAKGGDLPPSESDENVQQAVVGEGEMPPVFEEGQGEPKEPLTAASKSRQSQSSSASDTPDSWEVVSEQGRDEERQDEAAALQTEEDRGDALSSESLQRGRADYYSLGFVHPEDYAEGETAAGDDAERDAAAAAEAATSASKLDSAPDPSDLDSVSSSDKDLP